MDHNSYPGEHMLVRQGEVFPVLFFINQGKIKLYHQDKSGKESLLEVLEQGQVFGGETFLMDPSGRVVPRL